MEDYKLLLEEKKYKDVISILTNLSPLDFDQQLALGYSFFILGMYVNAEIEIKDIYNKNQDKPALALLLGDIYLGLERRDKAVFFYRRAARYATTREDAEAKLQKIDYVEELDPETEKIREIEGFRSTTTFADVKGMDKQKEYLTEHLLFLLNHPETIRRYNKKMGMGLMLYGPPGNGKTYLAGAIAGEAGCYTLIAKHSDIIGQYLGISAKNVRAIFDQARANAPCLLFFDEFDSIGTKRSEASGSDKHGGGQHSKEVVNELLKELQGIDKTKDAVFVVVGTNRPWDVDPALRRSGRLEDTLYVSPPNYSERKDSIAYHIKKTKHEGEINYGRISRSTIGFSHADIEKMVDEVALKAAKNDITTKSEQWIDTKDVLKVAGTMSNSLDAWFLDTKKELIGKKKVEKVNGKKVVSEEAGVLEPEERKVYGQMIGDVKRNASPTGILHRKIVKAVALYLW